MLSQLQKNFDLLYRIQQDRVSYRELIEFLFGETPPADHNFLRYDYAPFIVKVVRYGRDEGSAPVFSVIIPTYNRRDLLMQTLGAIFQQKGISRQDFEVIVVDNGSRDGTEEAIADFARHTEGTEIICAQLNKNYGADLARNVGVLQSRGRFFAFTDDDCLVPEDWLSEFKEELEGDPEIAGVGGFKKPKSTRERLDIYHRFLMWGHFHDPHIRTKDGSGLNRCGLTANVCYRRDVFEKLGGFNLYFKRIGFQEFKTRAHKSGIKLLYEPKMVEHFAYFNFGAHVLKLFPQSVNRYLLHKLYPDVWPNPSFLYFLKRAVRDIRSVFTSGAKPPLFSKSFADIVGFSFLSVITNFFLWFGKYWVVAFG
ncbi:MAG: hypothetical protein A3C11_00020 [Candidatus Sungbacteria bacterium RIFCSPHIGHO2_02_FULL_49_12]|uniref:Glycosyltransferase 2-like domain-containing protein n=1 Tax=Candidatus Sungbacteria bacterium RIFCSPHIGHO2_02_FULL_49_12 TaxID=1802271 RepID=A0A1G2KRV6_9BACT|nr:MAG: hypothetical protein A3C11_00020 [Candidatus Sungbacteria bacterium RIFCSPHIGHO2_02_FULL_49_12]